MNTTFVVNADDFGLTPEVNAGIVKAHAHGIVTSTSVMTNMPYFEAIHSAQKRHPQLGVGLHLCLSEGQPVTAAGKVTTLIGADGAFLSRKLLFERIAANAIDWNQVTLEVRAQADRLLQLGVQVDHWNSHQDVHLNPRLLQVVMATLGSDDFPCMRTHRRAYVASGGWIRGTRLARFYGRMPLRAVKDLYFERQTQRARKAGFAAPDAQLTRVPFHGDYSVLTVNAPQGPAPGLFEWVCHPATERRPEDRPTMDRPGEVSLLTAPDLKLELQRNGVQVANFTTALLQSQVPA